MFDDDDSDLLDLSKWRAKNEQPTRNEIEGNVKATQVIASPRRASHKICRGDSKKQTKTNAHKIDLRLVFLFYPRKT
jgi:hypothetical protein